MSTPIPEENAWHLREVIRDVLSKGDEDYYGELIDSSHDSEELANAIVRRLAQFGYPIHPAS